MKFFKNYGLSITLFILFFLSWILQYFFQWQSYVNEQQQLNLAAHISEFIPEFLSATFENWQSEFLQLFTFVLLTSVLIHKGSHESKDSDEKLNKKLSQMDDKITDFLKERR